MKKKNRKTILLRFYFNIFFFFWLLYKNTIIIAEKTSNHGYQSFKSKFCAITFSTTKSHHAQYHFSTHHPTNHQITIHQRHLSNYQFSSITITNNTPPLSKRQLLYVRHKALHKRDIEACNSALETFPNN